jgi:4-amino-4-deoxy-L-arabinose transferase-like glycosyltransferase
MATEALTQGAGTQARQTNGGVLGAAVIGVWHRWVLAGIAAIAACGDFYQLPNVGYGNTYYAAAVRSMLESWHNFFFVSFDPGGFVSVDKPPLGFWIQAASAKLLGFSGFSILLPEALAGVASVLVLFAIVRRVFGPVAGLLAAFALAVMPVSVVTNRNNTIDSLLVLAVLLAAWAVTRAVERGNWRWLLLGGALVGLGFNIKMLEAYLIVPALAAAYLVGAPIGWWKRVWHLAVAGAAMLALSLSWIVAVGLTPAALRPYVGSSATNSELELALGYNGIERLLGQVFRVSANAATGAATSAGAGPGGVAENGPAGFFRLLDVQLGGQASWLLALGLIGLLAAGWWGWDARARSAAVLWGAWTLTQAAFFSVAGFFHTYYLAMVAPGVAALAGIGAVLLWRDFRARGWRGWLLPIALLVTALTQGVILVDYGGWNAWMTPLIIGGSIVVAIVLAWYRVSTRPDGPERLAGLAAPLGLGEMARGWRVPLVATALGMAVLFVGPLTWTGVSLASGTGGGLPKAGPTAALRENGGRVPGSLGGAFAGNPPAGFAPGGGPQTGGVFPGVPADAPDGLPGGSVLGPGGGGPTAGGPGGSGGLDAASASLIVYLEAHQGAATYLFATPSAQTAAPCIIATGRPVMTLGGFSGADPILTLDQLRALIRDGQVRYFLVAGGGLGGPGGGSANSQLIQWVVAHGTVVPASAIGGSSTGGGLLYVVAASAA